MADKILIVDDDPTLRRLLGEFLQSEAFEVAAAANGQDALRECYRARPDLVVLDVMMPGMDGWETAARLRELADLPLILLTAKSAESDKLRGFRLGVDDYVTKPFSFAELAARIRAVLARSRAAQPAARRVHTLADLTIDLDRRTVERAGQPVTLTPTEFRLLEALLERGGQAVSEEALTQAVWGDYKQSEAGGVRRYVWLLRQKIEPDPANPIRLITVRGFGSRLNWDTPPAA
ncbi:MAG: response regulator transcription factor [Anaerolineales bacterium]|nr:response regulator transcription factor [Anaerolineales bacterium]